MTDSSKKVVTVDFKLRMRRIALKPDPEHEEWLDQVEQHRDALEKWLSEQAMARDVKIRMLSEVLAIELAQSEAETKEAFREEIEQACKNIASVARINGPSWDVIEDDGGDAA